MTELERWDLEISTFKKRSAFMIFYKCKVITEVNNVPLNTRIH